MKSVIRIVLVLAAIGVGVGIYMWNKPHRNIAKTKPAQTVTASNLVKSYQDDEEAANARFLGQVVQVSGIVRQIQPGDDGTTQILLSSDDLMTSVSCNLQEDQTAGAEGLRSGDQVTINGECTGILMDVVLERCVIVKE
ncbi:MAG: hypothetical protein R3330_10315 [Saprospiraceae bacterium]|nr:hypothetical protein [Saprospiraceae bacterium]